MDCIRKNSPASKFINLSSAAVYGNPKVIPIMEDTPLNPISPYGFHKEFAERICNEFSQLFGIKCLSLRIFSVYGPGLKKQILWDINKKIQESKESRIELFGSGEESRDFIYVDDLVNAIQLIANKGDFKGEVYNVANGQEITIKEVATLFVNEINPNIKLNFIRIALPFYFFNKFSVAVKNQIHSFNFYFVGYYAFCIGNFSSFFCLLTCIMRFYIVQNTFW